MKYLQRALFGFLLRIDSLYKCGLFTWLAVDCADVDLKVANSRHEESQSLLVDNL